MTRQNSQIIWSDKNVSDLRSKIFSAVDGVNIDNWTFEALVE